MCLIERAPLRTLAYPTPLRVRCLRAGAASSAAARQLPPGAKGSARLLASKALYGSDGAPLFSLSTHLGIEHCTLPVTGRRHAHAGVVPLGKVLLDCWVNWRAMVYKAAGGYSLTCLPSDGTSDGPGCPLLWLSHCRVTSTAPGCTCTSGFAVCSSSPLGQAQRRGCRCAKYQDVLGFLQLSQPSLD